MGKTALFLLRRNIASWSDFGNVNRGAHIADTAERLKLPKLALLGIIKPIKAKSPRQFNVGRKTKRGRFGR